MEHGLDNLMKIVMKTTSLLLFSVLRNMAGGQGYAGALLRRTKMPLGAV